MSLTVKVALWTVGVLVLLFLVWGVLQTTGHQG